MTRKGVLVIGAGISGLTTACELLRAGYPVTIWSKEPPGILPATSANAYAFWLPVRSDTDPRVERWADETFAEFERLALRRAPGVTMCPVFEMKTSLQEPWYAQKLSGFRHAAEGEIESQYVDAHVLDKTPVIDPPVYLTWLRRQVEHLGGKFVRKTATSLNDCPKCYTTVVNCTGLAARELVGDTDLHAARLQVLTIKPNGVDKVVFDSEGPNKLACVVPQATYVKIGAVYDERDESMVVDDEITTGILERCSRLLPQYRFHRDDVLSVMRCLRPKRSATRVELEAIDDSRYVVHNYGHNGTGYIVSFGAAREVVKLVESIESGKRVQHAPHVVTEPGMGTLEIFPLDTAQPFLFRLFKDLFENHWDKVQFGTMLQGFVLEASAPAKPTKVALFDGYLTVEFERWHMHVCLGETKGRRCAPVPKELADHRRPSRVELYRKLNKHGQPTFWGLRMFNGKNEEGITVFLPNPLLTEEMEHAGTPDWSKLELWDYLRKTYLNLDADAKDRTASRFSHD